MAKSVYYGTTLDEAQRIIDGDHTMFTHGMLRLQAFLSIFEAIGVAERSRREETDQPAIVQLLIKDRSYKPGNRIKIKSAKIVSDEALFRLTGYSFYRPEILDLPTGIVIRNSHKIFMVEYDGDQYQCSLRRRLIPALRTGQGKSVTIGDRVKFRIADGRTGVIEAVMGRTTQYGRMRAASSSCNRHAVTVANMDGLIIVSAVKNPGIWVSMVDKFCVIAEEAGIKPLICINKIDLLDDRTPFMDLLATYENVGYDTVMASAETGEGIEMLRSWMRDKTSSLVGLSGVGKSSLLNAIQSDLHLKTTGVATTGPLRGGRHTTTAMVLYPLEGGGYVADTPGLRELDFMDILPQMMHQYFPEMRRLSTQCAHSPCYHLWEPECAVKAAVQTGDIAISRYKSYGEFCSGDRLKVSDIE